MDVEDALRHALSLIDDESERLTDQGATDLHDMVIDNNLANAVLTDLLSLIQGKEPSK